MAHALPGDTTVNPPHRGIRYANAMHKLPWRPLVLAGALPLLACAGADPQRTPAEPGTRVIVTTTREWPAVAPVADHVQRLAGVPVREAEQLTPSSYRIELLCGSDAAACQAAIARIAADRSFALAAEAVRERIPAKPSRESSR